MGEYTLTVDEQKILLQIVRNTLEEYLKEGGMSSCTVASLALTQPRGAFVTLKKDQQLRGCIGRIVADQPLYEVVASLAVDSAINDSRFPPVTLEELGSLEIEISVLTPFQEVSDLDQIQVGRDGLMVRRSFYSGLLLPQVPGEYGWDKKTFLEHTCLKAGLPADAYLDAETTILKFSAIVFNESDFS